MLFHIMQIFFSFVLTSFGKKWEKSHFFSFKYVDFLNKGVYNGAERKKKKGEKMKRKKMIKLLKNYGFQEKRQGREHTILTNGERSVSIPRHKEIKRKTAIKIIKEAGLRVAEVM